MPSAGLNRLDVLDFVSPEILTVPLWQNRDGNFSRALNRSGRRSLDRSTPREKTAAVQSRSLQTLVFGKTSSVFGRLY